jgi:transposase InsO family protein
MFEDWLVAIGFPSGEGEEHVARKAALLRASLGTEGYRIYSSLVVDRRENYDSAKGHLAEHFDKRASTFYQRATFTRRQQQPGETITQYVSALREMAARCDFTAAELDDRVRDQFVAWVASDEIRKRLFQEPASKSLTDVISLAITIERSMAEVPALRSGTSTLSSSINRISERGDRNNTRACGNCGGIGHRPKTDQCPATGRRCASCDKLNHYAKCCRSNSGNMSDMRGKFKPRSHSRPRRLKDSSKSVNRVDDSGDELAEVTSVYVSSVKSSTSTVGEYKHVACRLNGVETRLILDLGAKVSLLNGDLYKRYFSGCRLHQPDITLYSYNGGRICCSGYVNLDVKIGDVTIPQFRFYVVKTGESMMGVNLFDAFGGKIHIGTIQILNVPTQPSMQSTTMSTVSLTEFPTLLKEFGTLKGFCHRPMVDPTVKPVQQKFWHPPIALRESISAELHRLETAGIIERIESSPWMSNIVVAKKRTGGIRLCTCMTDVNKAIIPTRYPLPTMEELAAKLAGAKVFSKLDMKWGYLQVELAKESRYLTAFVTHEGVFQHKTLPFGISSGPSAYQQIARTMTAGISGCQNLLDDFLIYGRDMKEHDERLRRVLARLQKYNATLRADKCVIGANEVEFNGHRISAAGILPLQSNVQGIIDMPTPKNAKELLRFISTASYYMKFVPSFSDIVRPLRNLLGPDAVWAWTPACQQTFDQLKCMIAEPPVLAHFDVDAITVVSADASAFALGANLSQIKDGVERPVAYASRVLSSAERKYSVSEREALACIWACERWHFYLYGRKFVLRTDHQALRTLLATGGSGHRPLRLHRWYDRLQQYNYTVEYKPGKTHAVPDCLSRAAGDSSQAPPTDDYLADEPTVNTVFGDLNLPVVTPQQLATASAGDETLSAVRRLVIEGWPDSRRLTADVNQYYAVREQLTVLADGSLTRGERAVIPTSLQRQVLQLAHEGHPGIVRMKQRCREAVWWPAIDKDVEAYVRNCQACIVSGKSVKPQPAPLKPVEWPSGPWRKIAIDIAGEFQSAPQHQRFLLVAVDLYSKWPEVMLCTTITTATVTEFLTSIFSRFGLVDEIITDNGKQLISAEFDGYLSQLGIKHCRTSVYNPQSNGAVERFNRVLKDGIKASMIDGSTFEQAVCQTLATYRSTVQCTTGVSPAKLIYAFDVQMPLSRLKQQNQAAQQPDRTQIKKRVQFKQDQMASRHDARQKARPLELSSGDFVRIKLPRSEHKLAPSFSEPREVKRANGRTVWLKNGQRWSVRRCILHSRAEADPDDRELADYIILATENKQSIAAERQTEGVRRTTRIRRPKQFGSDFVRY